ncbi:MAG: InlB B-repeat-containing protein [Alphaproteobacteria bacterium]|nr:InlB B-repeat-containing protein [Alphaproteobacteria bacterium]
MKKTLNFRSFRRFFVWALCAPLAVVCMVQLAVAEEVHNWCSAGNFGIADIFTPGISNTNQECEQCPIGSYNANTNSNIRPTVCTLCGAGSYTTSVGQSASSSCTACYNSAGVATWKSNSFVRKTFQAQHPDMSYAEPKWWCNPDNDYGYYCNIGRVVGLCEISTCSTPGYTLGTDIDYSKAGTNSYAIGRVTPTADNNWRDLTCYINGSASGDNCDNNRSAFAGMDYGEWMVYFTYSTTMGNAITYKYKYIYGESKCNASLSSYSNSTSGNNCWCHATEKMEGLLGRANSKYVVSDAIWRRVGSYSSCEQVCPNYCAEQVKTNQTTRTAMLKDSDGKPVFDTVCNANTYNINYVMNGGTSGGSQPTTATYNTPFNVTNPTKTGFVFLGWDITGMDSTTHDYGSAQNSLTQHTTATSLLNITRTWFQNLRATSGTVTFTARWGCAATGLTPGVSPLNGKDDSLNSTGGDGVKIDVSLDGTATTSNNASAVPARYFAPGEWWAEFSYGTVRGTAICSTSSSGTTPALNNGGKNCWCIPTMFAAAGGTAFYGLEPVWYKSTHVYTDNSECLGECPIECIKMYGSTRDLRKPYNNSSDVCLQIVYNINYHNVEENATYGSHVRWPQSDPVRPNVYTVNSPSFAISRPERDDCYSMTNWCENNALNLGCAWPKVVAMGSTGNKDFYANWEQTVYNITVNKNSGSGTLVVNGQNLTNSNTATCTCGSSVTMPTWGTADNMMTRSGKRFSGWSISSFTCNQNRTVNAQWCTCGTCTAGSNVSSCSMTGTVTNNQCNYNFSCGSGYNYNGSASGSGSFDACAGTSPSCSGNVLDLVWYKETTGATPLYQNPNPSTCTYGGDMSPLVPPTKTGYTFNGWTVTTQRQ